MSISTEAAKAYCDEQIASLTVQIDSLRGLKSALDNPELTAQIVKLLGLNGSPVQRAGEKKGAVSNFEKIARIFEENGNSWTATPDIVSATGLIRGTISNILYKSNKDNFVSKDHPDIPGRKLWRMRTSDHS